MYASALFSFPELIKFLIPPVLKPCSSTMSQLQPAHRGLSVGSAQEGQQQQGGARRGLHFHRWAILIESRGRSDFSSLSKASAAASGRGTCAAWLACCAKGAPQRCSARPSPRSADGLCIGLILNYYKRGRARGAGCMSAVAS